MKTDTIAAIATAVTSSGIGIIRVSGSEAIEIVNKVYQSKDKKKHLVDFETHTLHYGYILEINENGREDIIDEVMVAVMKGPRSFTTEDTVEIDCHGGILVMNKILESVIKQGARVAEPGEFTKRAFLNGRIDLSKAEAVMDIIHAKNEFALKSSLAQLNGAIYEKVKRLREKIIYEIAFIESALDDPEHISIEGYSDKLLVLLEEILKELKKLLESADNGKMLKEGIHTVIVGKPNAGKSSLLNLLVGEEKAIVTNVAGTTRDILEEQIKLHGIGLNIIDTAGIHFTEDVVEKIGVKKAKEYAANADLIIYVVDASVALDESDREIIDLIQNKKCIVLLNKTDLDSIVEESVFEEMLVDNYGKEDSKSAQKGVYKIIKTSTKENIGIDIFEETIKDMFFQGKIELNDEVFITNQRHKEAIENAIESLYLVKNSIQNNMPEDFYSIDLMSAYAFLGAIIGEEVGENLINEIFSKFCMGK